MKRDEPIPLKLQIRVRMQPTTRVLANNAEDEESKISVQQELGGLMKDVTDTARWTLFLLI